MKTVEVYAKRYDIKEYVKITNEKWKALYSFWEIPEDKYKEFLNKTKTELLLEWKIDRGTGLYTVNKLFKVLNNKTPSIAYQSISYWENNTLKHSYGYEEISHFGHVDLPKNVPLEKILEWEIIMIEKRKEFEKEYTII